MSGIDTTHHPLPHQGPRFSASDRPLPPTEARMTSRARIQLAAAIIAVYGLAALAVVAPAATLAVLLTVAVGGAALWGVFQLADRKARSWGIPAPEGSHPASPRVTQEDE
jgi:hypothetical protein